KKGKMLSVHAPGNWRKAELGGKPERVCKTSSIILKTFFQEINKNIPKEWGSTLECTHHGPYIEKPCLFIEIGSSEKEWQDKKAGKIIAETIKQSIDSFNKKEDKKFISAIGIGGPHYCPNFNKIQLNSCYALGHIIPEYALPLTEEMLQEAINKTIPKPEIILLDWKGLGKSEQRQQIIELLKKSGLEFKRTSEVEK
ncbi:MAG TPA: D-aminoacyl-tRNA deacylase, partial [Candidatus Paceibacterota bacterium]|nr:D-aminoacyl-tRNA deacylase [Candidatus Paceibacterota bacterium]